MKKIIYIILDGLGDLPVVELGNKTPLEAAITPNLDKLAQKGRTGIVYPVGKDVSPEPDVTVISVLGYDWKKYYTGRGPLECFSEGIEIHDGEVALRANFATLESDGRVIRDRRVGRDLAEEEAVLLAKEINSRVTLSGATFDFKNTLGHRGVLVIRSMHNKLSGFITNTDPVYAPEGVLMDSVALPGYENSVEANTAAAILNEFTQKSSKVLNESAVNKRRLAKGLLPANVILTRDAGSSLPKFPKVEELFNLKFGCFVEMPLERSIALLTGMEIIDVPSKTGHIDVDYSIWAKIAAGSINKYDGVYVHIKGPDEPAHDGNFLAKKEIIECIDKFFIAGLLENIDLKDCIVAVTADHATVCKTKAHSADPVPLLIAGGNIKPDGSMSFSEKAASLGSLGQMAGPDIISFLVKSAKD